jgi:hypothetical protein
MAKIFKDGRLVETTFKDFSFGSSFGSFGVAYAAGYYDAPATSVNLTQASTTQTHGGANHAHGAHAFIVASGAGTASGGTGTVEIEVSGTSIDDDGNRATSDTEVLTTDITTMTTDLYLETVKKWNGQVTFTIQPSGAGTHTTYSATFNYGLAKYEDFGNRAFRVTDFEITGLAGANDTSFDVELLHHWATGWTYHATAFVPGNSAIAKMSDDYVTEKNLASNEQFAYKRANLNQSVDGANQNGVLVRITTGSNNAVRSSDIHIGVDLK